ncbi:hypothetical protein EDB92DRAFT_2116480 [Lactarius akahatsu]|uniref:F-box domain-containing protein n=1 Tax=Lactarius akahatsu TaxID=416441 RepID=A0AAD4LA85_9AGAM|nr:hypothetical protein EDB92DRAFT_2116480 [Lactarius akahatsu]
MDHTMRPELDNVLQCLLLNGYSVLSLIDDILAHDHDSPDAAIGGRREDQRGAWPPFHDGSSTLPTEQFWKGSIQNYRHRTTIDVLSDNVFVEIFDFCLRDPTTNRFTNRIEVIQRTKKWQRLVHLLIRDTCQAESTILAHHLASHPGRIDFVYGMGLAPEDEDNVIDALSRHASRVHRIDILGSSSLLNDVATVMQAPFPVLTYLDLTWDLKDLPAPFFRGAPVIPGGGFLGGSAPRLQYLRLKCVSFPQLPTLLLSARDLVTLKLKDIYQNGYISLEAMVGSLAVLTRLRTLSIAFYDDTPPPDQRRSRPDPPMPVILPALTVFRYRGCCEYLEDFLAQIDTPRLDDLAIEYFVQEIQATQLSRFIDRTKNLKLDKFCRAEVTFFYEDTYVEFDYPQGGRRQARLSLKILGQVWLHRQVPCVVQVLGRLVPMFSNVNHLDAHGDHVHSRGMYITDWLPFFRLFPADTADPEETVTDVLPALRLIWLDEAADDEDEDGDHNEPVGSIEQFLSLRQLSGCPVTVVDTEDEFDRRR